MGNEEECRLTQGVGEGRVEYIVDEGFGWRMVLEAGRVQEVMEYLAIGSIGPGCGSRFQMWSP